jgi:hypothetical protein
MKLAPTLESVSSTNFEKALYFAEFEVMEGFGKMFAPGNSPNIAPHQQSSIPVVPYF